MPELIGFPCEDRIEILPQDGINFVTPLPVSIWCTFPFDLLDKLSNEQKSEMFKRIQMIINEYGKLATNQP